jgi:cyclic beta-1,2-glucan synthetase
MDPSALTALTDPLSNNPSNAPLRSELFGADHLADLARTLARTTRVQVKPGTRQLLTRLRDNGIVLRKARDVAALTARSEPLMPDAEWLLDNFFVIEDTLREVRTDLPRRYHDELPVAEAGPWAGLSRVYGIAISLISHTDSHLDDMQILRFVRAYQEVTPLTTGELWTVPTMLRLALLENLRRLAEQMLATRSERERAVAWVRQAAAARVPPLPSDPSDAFLVSWHQAVRDLGNTPPIVWDVAGDLTDVLQREHRRQAANQVSVANCVTSLRLLNAIDWNEFFERASLVEEVLRTDPTGVYRRQELATRDRYRQAVEQMAKASKQDEVEVARLALARAATGTTPRERHVGYYLVAEGRQAFARELGCRFAFGIRWRNFLCDHPTLSYFSMLGVTTGLLMWLVLACAASAGSAPWVLMLIALVVLVPISDVVVALVNALVCHLLPPRVLPKLDFAAGVPADARTIVVIPGLLARSESATALCERLELHYLANPDPQFRYALLTDWSDAVSETMPTDAAWLKAATDGIHRLNERHAPRGPDVFFLFHRKRLWNPSEGVWMGWERKRGKLDEFNRLLRGATDTSYLQQTGKAAELDVRFVLTLDADTVLPRDAATRLVATLAHPLNRPVLSSDGRVVVTGYGVLQPRVNFLYKTGLQSRFARIFAGSAGVDPYSSASSDVYQDLFGSGTFTGKGLYDVDAFQATAGHAFPENSILSHDLIESNFARCGLVTDVEVYDEFPAKYHAYARREHRWVRGDWQLLPWLGRKVPTPTGSKPNPLSAVGRWKIFDNLRRSLVAAGLVTLLACGWIGLPGSAWACSLAAVLVLAVPLALQLVGFLLGLVQSGVPRSVLRKARQSLPATLGQAVLTAVFLPNQAILAVDAILRTLYRLLISRRLLLEWETAAAAEVRLGSGFAQFARSMWQAVVLTTGLVAMIAWLQPTALVAAAPWLLIWFLSPGVAWWVSRPLKYAEAPITDIERSELRRIARKTWRFFETFVRAEDHWLPPDNFQEDPPRPIANRTSPTNKGLLLLSTLSAHDLAYITLPDLAIRMGRTFDTFERMERYRGHFLNWYETTTLRSLPPEYVSTVDSGNLLGCLLAVKNGLLEKIAEPIPSPAASSGVLDTLNLAAEFLPAGAVNAFREHVATVSSDLLSWDDWLERAEKLLADLPTPSGDGKFWITALANQIRGLREEMTAVCPWLPELRARLATDHQLTVLTELNTPASVGKWAERLPQIHTELAKRGEATALAAALERSRASELATQMNDLAQRADRFANAMDFRFLYNETRNLFSIGYNVPLERLDSAHYDLIASEAALTSYLAVARGVVPRKHWFQLGRLVTTAAGLPGLLSWGGTMFEYLMPRLLLVPPGGTMLDVAYLATVARQIEYGRQTRTPWGISESGFYVLSAEGDYQYQSFGVPGLGIKRGLGKDLVIAPYATLLATMNDAAAAVANFAALRGAGGEGQYGFYEAIDFTPDRLSRGEKCRVVKSYMAHHQGMGLCAIVNRLLGNAHCRRLYAEPAVRAVELLLQERVPLDSPEVRAPDLETEAVTASAGMAEMSRRLTTADTPTPRIHLLSNGNYTVMLTNSGGGYSVCRGMAVTRWRSDPTRDPYGIFIYLRETTTGKQWSVGHQPLGVIADEYEVIFSADKAEIRRRDGHIETRLEMVVAPDQDAEIRRVTLFNHDIRPHTLEVTSYAEVVLNDPRADVSHPAFGKLFLETEWLPQFDALLCWRRPRSADRPHVFAVQILASDEHASRLTEHETDRAKFLGRRRSPAEPEALSHRLSGTVGPVLDPVFALRKTVRLAPGSSATLVFVTAMAATRETALALADHYHATVAADRAFDLAWARSRVELRHLGVSPSESHVFQRLAGHVLFPPLALRSFSALRDNRLGQSGLWRFGLSGDLPVLAVCVSDGDGLPLARQALKAHAFWRGRGFPVDLVLLVDRPASYREELFQDLAALTRSSDSRDVIDKPGGVFVRKVQPGSEDRTLLLATARVVLYGDRGTLADQTDALARGRRLPSNLVPTRPAEPEVADRPTIEGLTFFNGIGGFTADGREYVVTGVPPAPWLNVIANPHAGCLATDSGAGYTWVGNSQSNRLTPWNNDPVSDPPAEVVYLRDEETGLFWTPTPRPAGGPTDVRHGPGYTRYTADRDGLCAELTVFVPISDPVKLLRLRVTNRSSRMRRLSATFFAEWVLGETREYTAPFIVTEIEPESGALLARCVFNSDYGAAVAFADTNLRPRSLTGDRTEFLGRNRSSSHPLSLQRVSLSDQVGPGLDPCAAIMGRFQIAPGASTDVVFVLGQTFDTQTATRHALRYRDPATAESALREVVAAWDQRLSIIRVRTPEPAFDVLVNRWLPYQVLACRLWGRSAFYQSGGAYGFRDQLQDVMALLYAEPAETRAQIVRAAAHQFPEGDVVHWWHPAPEKPGQPGGAGRGVRTRFSDDFLFLPYAVARYVAIVGDVKLLDEEVPFLRGPPLKAEEQEEYFPLEFTQETETVYGHCLRALAHGWKLGPHGLPLMGCGDWNDGMNLVGVRGTGESVWVAWFQILVRTTFATVAESRGEHDTARRLLAEAEQLRSAVEAHAWDGEWYLRAWFDDGTPLGSHTNEECRIDSLTQSWAVLSRAGDPARAQQAIDQTVSHLVDRTARLVKLFEPPFDKGRLNPGYIKGYLPGIRENGGQYTHAAIWLVQALAELGRGNEAFALWTMLSPLSHTSTPSAVACYKVEPYVVAADVYGVTPNVGRGGWTWYTGSAAWLYRTALETILGFTKLRDQLSFNPRIPREWPDFEVDYRHGTTLYRCRVENPKHVESGVAEIWLDGVLMTEAAIPLHDDGREHAVRLVLGA